MATLVKFRKYDKMFHDEPDTVFAFFPQLNYNKRLYGNDLKDSYKHLGQHAAMHKDTVKGARKATESEYIPLKQELESIGYDLKICK